LVGAYDVVLVIVPRSGYQAEMNVLERKVRNVVKNMRRDAAIMARASLPKIETVQR
jgi:hypothetical protein